MLRFLVLNFVVLLCFRYITAPASGFIHPMNEEEYDIISDLVKKQGKSKIPKNSRTKTHKNVYVKYWRLKSDLMLDNNGLLLFNKKRVLKKKEFTSVVAKAFRKNKSGGYKKLTTKAADSYIGLSGRDILRISKKNVKYKRYTARFTNKAFPKPVVAREVSE